MRHLRKLSDRRSYSRMVRTSVDVVPEWYEEPELDDATGEVTTAWRQRPKYQGRPRGVWKYLPAHLFGRRLASHGWAVDPDDETRIRRFDARPVHRRVKRWRNRNGYGYEVVNSSIELTADIARLISYHWPGSTVLEERGDFFDMPALGAHVRRWNGDAEGAAARVGGRDDDAAVRA